MKRLCLFLVAGVLSSTSGFAADVCPDITTIGALKSLPVDGCISGDKIFTAFSSNIADTVRVRLIETEGGPGPDNHGWNIRPVGGFGLGTFTFSYTISVDLVAAPMMRISQAQLDAQGGLGAAYTATKAINGGVYPTLNINESTPQDSAIIEPLATALSISDTLVVTVGWVYALSNTFAQFDTTVPEPTTLALFGSGLLALGFARRFRRR